MNHTEKKTIKQYQTYLKFIVLKPIKSQRSHLSCFSELRCLSVYVADSRHGLQEIQKLRDQKI